MNEMGFGIGRGGLIVPKRTLTTSVVGNGSITPANGSQYLHNKVISVEAAQDAGWAFSAFAGALSGATNPQNLTMNANKSVSATFLRQFYHTAHVTGDYLYRVDEDAFDFGTGAFSVEIWVKFTATTSRQGVIGHMVVTAADNYVGWGISTANSAKIVYMCGDGPGSIDLDNGGGTAAISSGTWYHLAMTRAASGGAVKGYMNCVLDKSYTETGNITNAASLYVGALTGSFGATASICQVRLWSTERSLAQLQAAQYTTYLGPTSGLVGEWIFTPGSGTNVPDMSGNSRDLTFGAGGAAPAWGATPYTTLGAGGPA